MWTYSVEMNHWTAQLPAPTFPAGTAPIDAMVNSAVFDPGTDQVLILLGDWQGPAAHSTSMPPQPPMTLWAYWRRTP